MESRKPSDDAERIVVRLPDGVRGRLAHRAKANGRSMNSETTFALKTWLDQADWVDAKVRGDEAGPWPGIIPDPLPEDLKVRVLFAARHNGRSADAEIAARVRASFDKQAATSDPPAEYLRLTKGNDWLAVILAKALLEVCSNPRLLESAKNMHDEQMHLIDEVSRVTDMADLPIDDLGIERVFGGPPTLAMSSQPKKHERRKAETKKRKQGD